MFREFVKLKQIGYVYVYIYIERERERERERKKVGEMTRDMLIHVRIKYDIDMSPQV